MGIRNWSLDPGKYLSQRDANQLLSVARHTARHSTAAIRRISVRNYFLIHMGLLTGLRVMEMTALHCGDIYLEGTSPCLFVRKGKGGKSRTVYFNSAFVKHCRRFLTWKRENGEPTEPQSPVFLSSISGGHMSTRALQKAFKHCAKMAGLPADSRLAQRT